MCYIDGPPDDEYADYNAPDWSPDHKSYVPLSDFFQGTQRDFTPITPLPGQDQNFFLNYYGNPAYGNPQPQGPDGTDEQ